MVRFHIFFNQYQFCCTNRNISCTESRKGGPASAAGCGARSVGSGLWRAQGESTAGLSVRSGWLGVSEGYMAVYAGPVLVVVLCMKHVCDSSALTDSSRMCCSWCARAFPLWKHALKVMELLLGPVAFNALCRTKSVTWWISYLRKKKSQILQVHNLKEILINGSREISVREKNGTVKCLFWFHKAFLPLPSPAGFLHR